MSRNLKPRAMPAAQDWLKTAGMSQTKIINNAMQAADIDRTLNRALQPDSKKAVEKWLSTANERGNRPQITSLKGAGQFQFCIKDIFIWRS